MESLLFLKEHEELNQILPLITSFKTNIYNILEEIKSDKNILNNCHILKGYFNNKKLQSLLKNGQEITNIKKNLALIEKLIKIELKKLD